MPGPRCVPATSAFYRAISLFQQRKPGEARALLAATKGHDGTFPRRREKPLAGIGTSHDDLIPWMACNEARALLKRHGEAPDKLKHLLYLRTSAFIRG
jgi:hypothetical protein